VELERLHMSNARGPQVHELGTSIANTQFLAKAISIGNYCNRLRIKRKIEK